jgi:hypothetical protein
LHSNSSPNCKFLICTAILSAGNTNWRGKLSTVDFLNKVACFVKE